MFTKQNTFFMTKKIKLKGNKNNFKTKLDKVLWLLILDGCYSSDLCDY